MAKIIVVDDDPAILELVQLNLSLQGHQVLTAADGIQGFALIQQELPQLVIMDVMMPEVDGYTVVQRIRKHEATQHVPVLMLTALGVTDDKVRGFDAGADDYLVKPFELPELLVRVRALLKRTGQLHASSLANSMMPELLSAGLITLIPDNLEVRVQGTTIRLTPMEFEILHCLLQNHGQAISLSTLLQEVWGYQPDDDVETIRVHVRHLRTKLDKAKTGKAFIETIYGGGYRLHPDGFDKA